MNIVKIVNEYIIKVFIIIIRKFKNRNKLFLLQEKVFI